VLVLCLILGINQVPGDAGEDTRIKEQIHARLSGLVSVHAERLEVSVLDGVVTITGSVASLGEQLTIGRIAGSITGVASIANNLSIRALDRPEAAIAQEVNRLLQRRPKFRTADVVVSASGTAVTLDGKVKRNADRAEAEEIAASALGVTRVVNRLQVESAGTVPDATIQRNVASVLANPITFGAIKDLEVVVEESNVTLKGTVKHESDRLSAERLSLGVEGVASVINLIAIEGK